MAPPVREIAGKLYRLIPSRFPPIDVYERLGPPALQARAQLVEGLTNPRLASLARSETIQGPGVAKEPRYQNWNHAPFAYLNPEGTWLLPPVYGALELALETEAAMLLAIIRREQFLRRTREAPIDLDMRLLVTEVNGEFADITQQAVASRDERWVLGERLRRENYAGAVHRRDDVPGGTFLSLFRSNVVGRTVQAAHYRFVWSGERVRSVYDFAGRTTEPEGLRDKLQSLMAA